MSRSSSWLAGLLALSLALYSVEARPRSFLRDATANLPSDPNTISTCTWWWDNADGAIACEDMAFEWGISMEDFLLWNPSITADCGNYLTGRSYCVEAPAGGTAPPPTTTTTTTGPAPTAGNGVETPLPTRPGMASNCDEFYYVEVGDSCTSITAGYGITTAQFIEWNPSVGADCTGLWASYYMCVSVIGHTPGTSTTTTTSTPPDPTTPSNGIETPLPIQPGMVDNCDAFHLVKTGDTCDTIAATYKISTTQFTTWNPTVGSSCGGLWVNAHVCVSIIGHNPNPTTTTTTAPATTTTASGPFPTQSGLVKTCTSFYKAQTGDTCEIIAQQKYPYINFLVLFKRWNPTVGENCDDLRSGYYYCVATELHQPMPGIIDTCKRYYQVKDGDSCWSIQQKYGITATEFNRWNPLVGSSCASLWVRYFVCIAV